MADTPSSILLTREQSTGSNTNLWGGYLIVTQRITEQAAKGYQPLAVTGDATISWANYTTGNTGQCANLKLTGTLVAAATLTFPAYMNELAVWNASGAAVTIKCSGGTGVTIPNNRRTRIYCDGVDYYSSAPTWVNDATTLTNNGDLVSYTQLSTAIAASVPAGTAGTFFNSAADTTRGYHAGKHTLAATGAISGAYSTTSAGGDERLLLTLAVGALGLTAGSVISATGTTAAVNTRYQVNKATSYTINLPAAPAQGDIVQFEMYGTGLTTFGLNGLKYNTTTVNPSTSGTGVQTFVYTVAATGWIDQ